MKNYFLICMAVYLISACSPLTAQESDSLLKSKYEHETLMLEGNRNVYCKNNQFKKIGFSGAGLEKEFKDATPESKEELHAFRKHRKRGNLLLIAGGVVFVSGAVLAPVIALPVFVGAFGTGIGTYYVGAYNYYKSNRHLQKAIWLRNRDLLVKQ